MLSWVIIYPQPHPRPTPIVTHSNNSPNFTKLAPTSPPPIFSSPVWQWSMKSQIVGAQEGPRTHHHLPTTPFSTPGSIMRGLTKIPTGNYPPRLPTHNSWFWVVRWAFEFYPLPAPSCPPSQFHLPSTSDISTRHHARNIYQIEIRLLSASNCKVDWRKRIKRRSHKQLLSWPIFGSPDSHRNKFSEAGSQGRSRDQRSVVFQGHWIIM